MDSLPHEIIDKIIDDLPLFSLRHSSLVAKRWRTRSQQRVLYKIYLVGGAMVRDWHREIQSNPGRISSYVQFAIFKYIPYWTDPWLLCRVLANLSSLTTLWILHTEIPDKMPERVSQGGLGEGVTTLHLQGLRCPLSRLVSVILAFPGLQDLTISDPVLTESWEAPPTYPMLPRRKPFDSLYITGIADRVPGTLANAQFTSRRLIFDVQAESMQRFLVISSVTIVKLVLMGVYLPACRPQSINSNFFIADSPGQWSPGLVILPLFPILTSLKIYVDGRVPSPRLIRTLTSISTSSVPVLTAITLQCWWWSPFEPDRSSIAWDELEGWLVEMAKNAVVEGGLVLTLTRWREDWVPEVLFPKFKEVGKIITNSLDPNTRQWRT